MKNILLVEDSDAGRDLMKEAFNAAEFDGALYMAKNGNEALDFLKQAGGFSQAPRPDLILLDLNLPRLSGLDVLAEIHDTPFQKIPLVVLTGSNSSKDIQACLKYRCRYVLKPSRFHELVELVKSLPEFY